MPPLTRWKRPVTRVAILLVVGLILIDATPQISRFHGVLERAIQPVLDVTGLWQGTWQLFAPNVDKVNTRIEAEVEFADGRRVIWRSPDWSRMTGWQRFFLFRHQEFYDTLRMDRSEAAWPALAEHLARTVRPPDGSDALAVRVELWRLWAEIPAPEPGGPLLPAGPYVDFENRFSFYTWPPDLTD